jgi:hypothetical protein
MFDTLEFDLEGVLMVVAPLVFMIVWTIIRSKGKGGDR